MGSSHGQLTIRRFILRLCRDSALHQLHDRGLAGSPGSLNCDNAGSRFSSRLGRTPEEKISQHLGKRRAAKEVIAGRAIGKAAKADRLNKSTTQQPSRSVVPDKDYAVGAARG